MTVKKGPPNGAVGLEGRLEMTVRDRSILEQLEYDLAVRYFASAFEACERLPTVDQQLVLKDVAKRVTELMSAAQSEEAKEGDPLAGYKPIFS
jgi:hypothetical protein